MAGWIIGDVTALGFIAPGLFEKIDTFKEAALFFVGFAYVLCRIYYFIRKNNIELRQKEWEQEQREKNGRVA